MKKRITPATQRICVECGMRLTRQQRSHYSSAKYEAEKKRGTQYVTGYCMGPGKTPGAPPRVRRGVMHFRYYAGPWVLCGLKAGRTKGQYKDAEAEVPYGRVNSRLEETTCVECLVLVVQDAESKLAGVSAEDRAKALEQAQTRHTMNKVRKLVTS